MKSQCQVCNHLFPDTLIAPFMSSEGNIPKCCPICALRIRNRTTGLTTEFQGEHAQYMLEQARDYAKRKGYKI